MNAIASLATVTVTYHPVLSILRSQIEQLPHDALRILIDNASPEPLRAELRTLAAESGVLLIENETNLGLAEAINIGIEHALAAGCERVLFMDQDTEPGSDGVVMLCAAHERLAAFDPRQACMGPRMVDHATGLEHGFHKQHVWRWVRTWPAPGDPPVRCANLNGSGTLVPRAILEKLGGLESDFFIDHVDTEWSFRVQSAGFGLYGTPDVAFKHRMGERTWRFWWFGWRIWPYRSPLRHRFLFCNAARLMRRPYVPTVWKVWAIAKLGMTIVVHAVFDDARIVQVQAMWRGLREGLRPQHRGKDYG